MFKSILPIAVAAFSFTALADERFIDFSTMPLNQAPAHFQSTVTGKGDPGDWKIVLDDMPLTLEPLLPNARKNNQRPVLAQLSKDATDEHFPLLIYTNEVFGNFTVSTRFKCVSGEKEQMAGIAFRIQDARNYYVVRASSLGNTFRFYKFVNGERSAPLGPEVKIPAGTWHEMSVTCKGNEIRCGLDGKEVISTLVDNSFSAGKIGLWTKSDSVSHFADTRIVFTPREPLAQRAVRETLAKYPKLEGLKLYGYREGKLQVLASSKQEEVGKAGSNVEEEVIKKEKVYCSKAINTIAVILPLRDRNGEAVAALRVTLKSFAGQTEGNAVARALPVNKFISEYVQSAKDMIE
jgi:hypothetical protein